MSEIVNLYNYEINDESIKNYVSYLSTNMKENRSFTIVFINNEDMINYNLEFREKDRTTDVLTFCEEGDYLGDILINYDIIKAQADEYNHSFRRELYFLITHGFLHLLGYDHLTIEEEEEMFSLQNKLLEDYNIRRDNE